MRPVDADALLKAIDEERQYLLARGQAGAEHILVHNFRDLIDNAPTVPLPDFKAGYKQAIIDGKTNYSRPQGEWKLISVGLTNKYQCSLCGRTISPMYSPMLSSDYPFCHCGAQMKGGAE